MNTHNCRPLQCLSLLAYYSSSLEMGYDTVLSPLRRILLTQHNGFLLVNINLSKDNDSDQWERPNQIAVMHCFLCRRSDAKHIISPFPSGLRLSLPHTVCQTIRLYRKAERERDLRDLVVSVHLI